MPRRLSVLLLCVAAARGQDLQERLFQARDRALPALVSVQPVLDVFRGGRKVQSTATGSGVILRDDGLLVTNFHVAGHAKKVFCTLADKTRVPAALLGGDPATDLAVLRLDMEAVRRAGSSFGTAKLGSASPVEVGEFVVALGSPRGLSMTLTSGVVSNTERFFGGDTTLPTGELTGMYNNWIQTDAAINPGNSGGPLVNLRGEVIGINTRGIRSGQGLGFAIPADVVRHVVEEIVAHGRVRRSWAGLDRGLQPLSVEDALRGVRVGHVAENSPAADAGIEPGDVLLEIGGAAVQAIHLDEIPPILRRIADAPVGAPLAVKLRRGEKTRTVEVRTREVGAHKAEQFAARRFGMTVRAITERYARRQGLSSTEGVLVTGVAPSGPASAGDLRGGDVIYKLGAKTVAGLDEFESIYGEIVAAGEKTVLLSVRRGGALMFRTLSPATKDLEEEE